MIKIRGLKHRWRNDQAWLLEIPTLDIQSGLTVAVMGLSGCGKSTLLAILSGWLKPTEGQIWVNEVALHSLNEHERGLWRAQNLSWQGIHCPLFNFLSVRENLDLPTWFNLGDQNHHLSEVFLEQDEHFFNLFGLDIALLKQSIEQLSLGEKQRVEVMRAVSQSVQFTLLDEPTSHLDESTSSLLTHTLLASVKQIHHTLIIATHDTALATQCDRIITLQSVSKLDHEHQRSSIVSIDDCLSSDQAVKTSPNPNIRPEVDTKIQHTTSPWIAWYFAWLQMYFDAKMYSAIFLASVIAIMIPMLVDSTVEQFQKVITSRSESTSLIIGALNSPYDLFFGSLYFTDPPDHPLRVEQVDELLAMGQYEGTPILVSTEIDRLPLVGTDATYYSYRNLQFVKGRAPHRLGEVCVSETSAQQRSLAIGMTLQTQPSDLFKLNAPYPIELTITGIFKARHPADQTAHFTTLTTAWAALGYAHSHHEKNGELDSSLVVDQSVKLDRLHLHNDPDSLPISALLMHSQTAKKRSILKARLSQKNQIFTLVEPNKIAKKTLNLTDNIQRILKPLLATLSLLTLSLIFLMLTQRYLVRAPIREGLFALGLRRRHIFLLSLREYMIFILLIVTSLIVISLSFQHIKGWEVIWLNLLSFEPLAP